MATASSDLVMELCYLEIDEGNTSGKTRFSILNGILVNFPCTPMGGPSGVWDGYIEAGLFSHNTRSCLDWMELGGI